MRYDKTNDIEVSFKTLYHHTDKVEKIRNHNTTDVTQKKKGTFEVLEIYRTTLTLTLKQLRSLVHPFLTVVVIIPRTILIVFYWG